MALALLQLRPAHRGVRRDGEHEIVDLRLAAPVLRERLVADDRVLLVLHEVERPGADRLLVDLLGRAGLEHRVGVFLRLHARIFHREVRQERRFRLVERDAHRVVVDLLDRLDELRHPHVVVVRMVGARHLEVRVVFLPLALEHEDHVVGVEVARRLPRAMVVPLHALAQVEGVDGAVRRDVPLLGKARHDLGAAALEVDDAAVDLAVGVERRAGRIDARVEILGTAFRAVHERLGGRAREASVSGRASATATAVRRRTWVLWFMRSSSKRAVGQCS